MVFYRILPSKPAMSCGSYIQPLTSWLYCRVTKIISFNTLIFHLSYYLLFWLMTFLSFPQYCKYQKFYFWFLTNPSFIEPIIRERFEPQILHSNQLRNWGTLTLYMLDVYSWVLLILVIYSFMGALENIREFDNFEHFIAY